MRERIRKTKCNISQFSFVSHNQLLYIDNKMKLPHQPKAVIFDMDGLLIDTVPLYVKAMVQASIDVGSSLTSEYIMSVLVKSNRTLFLENFHS